MRSVWERRRVFDLIRDTMSLIVWTCVVHLVTFSLDGLLLVLVDLIRRLWLGMRRWRPCWLPPKKVLETQRVYRNNGYLMVSCNGGLNQMRVAICDMVTFAQYLNVTLIVPVLDKMSFWKDPSEFHEIFDMDHFITSLRDEVRILKELPLRLKGRVEKGQVYSMPPICWSNITYYYHHHILPLIHKHKVVHLNRINARLGNNDKPVDIQRLRCQVNNSALQFTCQIEELWRKVIDLLKKNGPVVVLHLRYNYPWWKEKIIDSEMKRVDGLVL